MLLSVYSYRNESTGLIRAALSVWKLTVASDTSRTTNPARTKTSAEMVALYGKVSIHSFIPYHTSGVAMAIERKISLIYSVDNKIKIPGEEDPRALRIPISFVRCTAL